MMTDEKEGQQELRGRRERRPPIWLPPDAVQEEGTVDPNAGLPYPDKPQLIVFGGSFDPVHSGHIHLARKILESGLGDEVLFVPAKQSPLKAAGQSVTAAARMEMLRRAIADALAEKREYTLNDVNGKPMRHTYAFSVSDIELQRAGAKSYTIDTLETLRRIYPGHDVKLLIGTDCLMELDKWRRFGEIISNFGLLIYPRPGSEHITFLDLAAKYGTAVASKLFMGLLVHPSGGEMPRQRPRKMRPTEPEPLPEAAAVSPVAAAAPSAKPVSENADDAFMDAPATAAAAAPAAAPVEDERDAPPPPPPRRPPLVPRLTAADFPMMDISSTALRAAIAAGKVPEGALAPSVLEYILKKGLYRK